MSIIFYNLKTTLNGKNKNKNRKINIPNILELPNRTYLSISAHI